MARKITQDAVNAFMSGGVGVKCNGYGAIFSRDNTVVHKGQGTGTTSLHLHGHLIARRFADGSIEIGAAGWLSNTTKERLNGIPGVHIQQKKGQWYLNGVEWDGSWQKV